MLFSAPMRRLIPILFLFAGGGAYAQVGDVCVSCEEVIKTEILMFASPYHKERQPVCSACAALQKYCFTCRLPAKKGLDLKDGRVICQRDAKAAILSGEEAKMMFEEVKRDMILMLRGSKIFPDRNVKFALTDRVELESLSRLKRFPSTHNALLGLTRSRAKGDDFEHEITVLAGMPRNKFLGVCAHEYGHAWMQENLDKGRTLDSDAIEGFCELLAYKYIDAKGDEVEKKLLLQNDYTNGQIDLFVRAEGEYNFYQIMKWISGGEDASLAGASLGRVLVLQDAPVPDFSWPPPSAVATAAPTNLVLKSISGTAKRRFAMINGATLTVNESAKILLASGKVSVRCLEIKDGSVIVQIDGKAQPKELFLVARESVEPTKANGLAP
jgi:protein DA1